MTIGQLKDEFRLICTDTWGNAMDLWFEIAGHCWNRGMLIPKEWNYSPGLGDPTEPDNYFYEMLNKCTDEQLEELGLFMFRYCQFLKYKGIDY